MLDLVKTNTKVACTLTLLFGTIRYTYRTKRIEEIRVLPSVPLQFTKRRMPVIPADDFGDFGVLKKDALLARRRAGVIGIIGS